MSRRGWTAVLLAAALACLLAAGPLVAESHLLVVTGVGGEQVYTERFHAWATRVVEAALEAGLSEDRVVYLAERPDLDPERIRGRSTGENLLAEIEALTTRSSAGDTVWILLFGHGSGSAGPPRFNLPGRDLVAEQYAAALEPLSDRRVVFINTSSASGGFIAPLAKEGRVVITATRSGAQGNEALFGGYIAEAFDGGAGDRNKDGRTSALEAFEFAQREVERYYRQVGQIRTEHALLEDNGDGTGSLEPAGLDAGGTVDGRLASLVLLGEEALPAALTERSRELAERRGDVERRIDELRLQRESLDEDLYLEELQELMVELALVDRELAEAGAKSGEDAGSDGSNGEPDS
ncbi:MAG: hypothetical protein OXG81_15290 [Acidobacteria bacterium]|nr:hypothetical protein [Acidobacteriota bacterium]